MHRISLFVILMLPFAQLPVAAFAAEDSENIYTMHGKEKPVILKTYAGYDAFLKMLLSVNKTTPDPNITLGKTLKTNNIGLGRLAPVAEAFQTNSELVKIK